MAAKKSSKQDSDSFRQNGPNDVRDGKGRFKKGNPGGPGNPKWRIQSELRAAVNDAVKPEDIRDVVMKLLEKARDGDNDAAKVLMDRVLGRPAQAKPDAKPLNVGLPDITNAKDCVAAASRILQAMDAGELDTDDASRLSGLVEFARKTIETSDLEKRIEEIEAKMKR